MRGRLDGCQLPQEGLEVLVPDPHGVLEAVAELVGGRVRSLTRREPPAKVGLRVPRRRLIQLPRVPSLPAAALRRALAAIPSDYGSARLALLIQLGCLQDHRGE